MHELESMHGVRVCANCGAALHRSGYWYLGGFKSKQEPECTPYEINDEWKQRAVKMPQDGE